MVIDKNTTQINSFSKGMNTDTSDMYMEEGSYRLAKNLRYITNTGENSGELHMIEGAKQLQANIEGTITATTQLRDLGIIVTEKYSTWRVYTINHADNDRVKCVAEINGSDRVVGCKKLSLVARYEDDENAKLYIADGKGPVLIVQLLGDKQTEIDRIVSYPAVKFMPPRFCGLIDGKLKSGVYEYSYQYYIKHAQQTEISPSTKLIPLHNGALTVEQSNRIQGYEEGVTTNKGIKIDIQIDQRYNNDRIRIFRIGYHQVGQLPDIDIIYDGEIKTNSSGYMEYSDTGNDAISVLTLEEYNSMTGIHIIPKTIESLYDYMFASNIRNDNPIYQIPGIDNVIVHKEFITKELIGDTCLYKDRIDIRTAGATFPSNFVGDVTDTNNTYMNPYVTYSYKSLRRGETYRYGYVLYDKYGNASAVKYIDDITVPSFKENKPFEYKNGKLYVYPIGIKFTFNNLPPDVVAYEIVRCGRDESDISTVTQCVVSRPVQRVFRSRRSGVWDEQEQDLTFPLTPTGWLTVMDAWFGVETNDNPNMYNSNSECTVTEADWWATNSTLNYVQSGKSGFKEIKGNDSILQVVSPEYCYQSDTIKDMLKANKFTIEPLMYIHPLEPHTKATSHVSDGTSYVRECDRTFYNFGNDYTWLRVEKKGQEISSAYNIDRAIIMDGNVDTLSCYYYRNPSSYVDGGSAQFKETYLPKVNANDRYAYVKLYGLTDISDKSSVDIKSIGFPESLSWDDFADAKETYTLKYTDKLTTVGGKNFCNWVSGGMYGADHDTDIWSSGGTDIDLNRLRNLDLEDDSFPGGGMMGPGGKTMVVALENGSLGHEYPGAPMFGTYLCNIKKNGTPKGDPKYSTYRSYGNYSIVKTSQNEIEVFDGDCFIQPFEYISLHKWYHPYLSNARNAMIAYSIPMETSINIAYSFGQEISKNINSASGNITNTQVEPANVNNIFIQEAPLYAYNTAYSATSTSKTLIAEDSEDKDFFDSKYDFRTYNSLTKSNDEYIDSWLKFQAANYIDVDTRYGEITGLRKFNNSLVFWQENAAGLLSVNERTQITDDTNMPLILGTAGVLSRYDYLNTSNGMRKDEYADTQSDTTLYWWDHNKHEIIGYSGGLQTVPVSKSKFVQNLLNRWADDNTLSDKPILAYDKMFNEVLFKVSDQTLVFGETIGAFSSIYDIDPSGAITFKDCTMLTKGTDVYKWNVIDNTPKMGEKELFPYLRYVVNANAMYTKVFDNIEFGGRFYGGGDSRTYINDNPMKNLTFRFTTPLKQQGTLTGDKIDNTEYNFRFAVPRADDAIYGGRLRGKTMQVELTSSSNDYDFSLQYILTKYRISWT